MKRARLPTLILPSFAVTALLCCAPTSANAAAIEDNKDGTEVYAQLLIDRTAKEHPELNLLSIHAVPPEQSGSRIIASNIRSKVGKKSDPDDLDALTKPDAVPMDKKSIVDCGLPLKDMHGKTLGTMVTEVKYSYTKDPATALKHAEEIRDGMAKELGGIHHLFSLYYPVDGRRTYAQQLIDETLAQHPELNTLSFHATPPGAVYPRIIASGQVMKLGRRDDPDDIDAMTQPFVLAMDDVQIVDTGMALLDSSGHVIGTLVSQVKYSYTKDKDVGLKHVMEIRDSLKPRIASLADLLSDPHN